MQSFGKIREGGYLYVDKTEMIHRLVTTGNYYFLSRPRRFGKSLLLDTLEELFKGSRNLFNGLWIEDHWDWSKRHPVIHFNFAEIPYKKLGLEKALEIELERSAAQLGLLLETHTLQGKFRELIEKAAEAMGQVVILIDEYDKALVDFLQDTDQLEINRSVMKEFYSVLKGRDAQIRFLLLTGVSRFSRVSIFSDLNNLRDITISNPFSTIAGITQEELERDFSSEIESLKRANPTILEDIREWYNGYFWGGNETLYNPFSLLNFMADPEFRNYWYTTGTPTFLFDQLKKNKLGDLDGTKTSENALAEFNVDRLDMKSLLFQTGYLTIKNREGQIYTLGYPNREVKESLLDGLLNAYREPVVDDSLVLVADLRQALRKGDVPTAVTLLDSLIGEIPYDHWNADKESIFTIITVLVFRLAGVDVYTEVHSSKGRCDVLVKTDDYIYVIELKLDGSAQEALDQILNRQYLQPYGADLRKKVAVGVAFFSEGRNVAEYLVKEV